MSDILKYFFNSIFHVSIKTAFLAFTAILAGCASICAPLLSTGLPGMIYDNFNNPVDGAVISLFLPGDGSGGKEESGNEVNGIDSGEAEYRKNPDTIELISDIDGRFILPLMDTGEYDITITKQGFESQDVHISFHDPKQVLYIKMTSLRYLKQEIEKSLIKRDFQRAESLVGRAAAITPEDPVVLYLQAVLFYLQEKLDRAAFTVKKLESLEMDNPGLRLLNEDINRKSEGKWMDSDEG